MIATIVEDRGREALCRPRGRGDDRARADAATARRGRFTLADRQPSSRDFRVNHKPVRTARTERLLFLSKELAAPTLNTMCNAVSGNKVEVVADQ